MIRIPKPGVAVFGRNVHVRRTGGAFEILQAPGVGFADRHRRSIRLETFHYISAPLGWAKARAVSMGSSQCWERRVGTLRLADPTKRASAVLERQRMD